MRRFVPLRTSTDIKSGWKRYENHRHAIGETALPVALAELPQLLADFLLAFARLPDNAYRLVALMGLQVGHNHYVNDEGRWFASYVPAHLRAYPFALAIKPDSDDQAMVCFDHDSGLFRPHPDEQDGEQRFFTDDGRPQPLFEGVVNFLRARQENLVLTQRGVDALAEHQLLTPFPLPPAIEGEEPLRGFYRFDEEKYKSLDGELLLTLRNVNALTIAYAQLFSMARLPLLKKLATGSRQHEQVVDIEKIFGRDGDIFKF